MLSPISYLILSLGSLATAYVIYSKSRGSFRYWLRSHQTRESWAIGRTLTDTSEKMQSDVLVDANALVRDLDKRSSRVIRQWDRDKGTLFIGVLVDESLKGNELGDFEQRHLPKQTVIRLSGQNRSEELTPLAAAHRYAEAHNLELDFAHPAALSGQSFRLYQWPVIAGSVPAQTSLARLCETSAQWRDNFIFTILLTVISVGLLGTRQPLLFATGVGLMVLLSGFCKFVFMHQRTDEADEIHLQNY